MKTHEFQKGTEVVRVREPENPAEERELLERIVDELAGRGELDISRDVAVEGGTYTNDGVFQISDNQNTDSVRMRVLGEGDDEQEVAEVVTDDEMFG